MGFPPAPTKEPHMRFFFVGKGAESNVNDISSKKAARKEKIIKNAPKM